MANIEFKDIVERREAGDAAPVGTEILPVQTNPDDPDVADRPYQAWTWLYVVEKVKAAIGNATTSVSGLLSASDKTKLDNQSGTNTGDETTATIKSKLGAASNVADGYLLSSDWSLFDNKQDNLGFTPENAANKNATNGYVGLTSGVMDGDQLPSMSTTKKGGVPATGTPSGKFLKDDGTWDVASGGSFNPNTDQIGATITPNNTTIVANMTVNDAFEATQGQINNKRSLFVTDTIATTGSTAIDFTTDGETNITQTGSITFTGSAGATYKEKMYIIKGSRNVAHTFTFPVGWKSANNTLPSSMFDNAISIWTSGSEVFYFVNIFDDTSGSFVFSSGFVLYPEVTKVKIYVSATIDQAVIPSTSWFTFSSGRTVSAVSLSFNYIEITCGSSFAIGDTDTINYTGGSGRLQDLFGNLLANFSESVSINILVRDQFNRANSTTTLGNADTGQTWQNVSPAVFGISSNRMYCASAVDTGSAVDHRALIDSGQNDHSVTLDKIYPISAQYSQVRILLRYTNSNNYYSALFTRVGGSSTITAIIASTKSGVSTVKATLSGISTASPASEITKTYSAKISGTTISVYEGTTLLGAYTDTDVDKLLTGTNIGVQFTSSSTSSGALDRVDNLLVSKI